MQKLIWFKTANEALYIGRLLPKNPKKRKKRKKIEVNNYNTTTKKLLLLLYDEKRPNQMKIYNKGKNKKTKKNSIKPEEKSKKYPG